MTGFVELDGVSLTYDTGDRSLVAAAGIDLSVPAGRFVSVVGPTGCGKSTILNAVAGLMRPSAGVIRIAGTPLRGINRQAGYLFQQDALLPWKTVLENVVLGLELHGVPRAERAPRARDWINRVGLAGFEQAFPHQLSGGMRKRTAVAQTWVLDPELLLMDEPFGALDVQTRQIMENELLALWTGSGKTVLFVTHDLDEAVSLSDEVVLLSAGPESHIVGRFDVTLPRPRDLLEIRTLPEFQRIYTTIWSALREEVMKSYERRFARTN